MCRYNFGIGNRVFFSILSHFITIPNRYSFENIYFQNFLQFLFARTCKLTMEKRHLVPCRFWLLISEKYFQSHLILQNLLSVLWRKSGQSFEFEGDVRFCNHSTVFYRYVKITYTSVFLILVLSFGENF